MARLHLTVGGMHCSFRSQSLERAYERTEGVDDVSVSLAHEEAVVDYDPGVVDETTLRDTLRDVGYSIRDPDRERAFEEQEEELRTKLRRTLAGGAASAMVALLMVGMWVGLAPDGLLAPEAAPGPTRWIGFVRRWSPPAARPPPGGDDVRPHDRTLRPGRPAGDRRRPPGAERQGMKVERVMTDNGSRDRS